MEESSNEGQQRAAVGRNRRQGMPELGRRQRQRPHGGRAGGREGPERGAICKILDPEQGLYAKPRSAISNRDPIQGEFCIYSDRD
jgi:hypothetical protein